MRKGKSKGKGKVKVKELSIKTKAVLAILIHEIQEILDKPVDPTKKLEEIRQLLNIWIVANDLHPERVETLTLEELKRKLEEE